MASKVDLHLHTRHSNRSAEWLLRRFDFPDSYSDPAGLYEHLARIGMNFFTFTDHNTIDGCLDIADRPGAFISTELTTFFPDYCKVHILAWNITEGQAKELLAARDNIFELQQCLAKHKVAHAVAHPLYDINSKLRLAHVEQLVLLFKHFEGVNGLRDRLLSETIQHVLGRLTPQKIEEYANRHKIEPTHAEPWKKILTAGSDDHGGLFPGSAYTETANVKSPSLFLDEVRAGRCIPVGAGGTPLVLSHSLYSTAYSFIKAKFPRAISHNSELIDKVFAKFMEGKNPTDFSFFEKMNFFAQGILSGQIFELAKPGTGTLWRELADYFSKPEVKLALERETRGVAEPERRAFLIANLFANQLAFRFFTKFIKQLSSGNMLESLQAVSGLVPIIVTLSPYIYSFHSQAPSRAQLRQICQGMGGEVPAPLQNRKRAWFTDTLEDVNGVATTIRKMTAAGVASGADLIVVTSRSVIEVDDIPIKNFAPIGEFEIPEYELQKLSFPPILQVLDYIQRERFTELIISTPGPIGVTALLAAKMLGLQTSGIYHTDFPQYVRILTDDSYLETMTWNYMHWFYSQLDLIYVNSETYRDAWIERGISSEKLRILPRGLDTTLFHPSKRDRDFWLSRGLEPGQVGVLYVGRVSKEKDIDILAQACAILKSENLPVRLLIVGDGPYAKELKQQLPDACFTGVLRGSDLAAAYASADIFGFPSTTDTFGNVVIEAQAAGIPTIVSDVGGPKDLVEHGVTGFVTKAWAVADFADALRTLVVNAELRKRMGEVARERVQNRNWTNAFRRFWDATLG